MLLFHYSVPLVQCTCAILQLVKIRPDPQGQPLGNATAELYGYDDIQLFSYRY